MAYFFLPGFRDGCEGMPSVLRYGATVPYRLGARGLCARYGTVCSSSMAQMRAHPVRMAGMRALGRLMRALVQVGRFIQG